MVFQTKVGHNYNYQHTLDNVINVAFVVVVAALATPGGVVLA
jgi:hypothetical protein